VSQLLQQRRQLHHPHADDRVQGREGEGGTKKSIDNARIVTPLQKQAI
jgi:hypothetical protein